MAAAGAPLVRAGLSSSPKSLEDVLATILDSEAFSLDLVTLQALRRTSKTLKTIINPYLCKVRVGSEDIGALSCSSLAPHITAVKLVMSRIDASITSIRVTQFCQINLPNLEKLTVDNIDLGSLPLLARHGKKWSKLKDFSATIIEADPNFDNNTHLADFESTQWPLEYLSIRFHQYANFTFTGCAILFRAFPKLKSLTLNPMPEQLAKELVKAELPLLERLWLVFQRQRPQWQPAGEAAHEVVRIISKQGNWPNLQTFTLSNVDFTFENLSLLAGASLLSKMDDMLILDPKFSRDQARMIFRWLHGGILKWLSIRIKPESLLELRGIHMPMLETLELDLLEEEDAEEEVVVDEAFDALFKASMPKLEKIHIAKLQGFANFLWNTPPAVNESANIFPSLKYFIVAVHITAAPACAQFLGRQLVNRSLEGLEVVGMHFKDLADPLEEVLKDVRAAPKLSSLKMFTLGHGIKNLPSHIEKLPGLKLIAVREKEDWESDWMVNLQGQLMQQPIEFDFNLEASSALELAEVAEYFDVEWVTYHDEGDNLEEQKAKLALYEAFPEAEIEHALDSLYGAM